MIQRTFLLKFLATLAVCIASDLSDEEELQAAYNPYEGCQGTVCVSKCCSEGTLLNFTDCSKPLHKDDLWKPKFFKSEDKHSYNPPKNMRYIHQFPDCEVFPLQPHIEPDDRFYLLETGQLNVPLYSKSYDPEKYCIDMMMVNESHAKEIALLCFETPAPERSKVCDVAKMYVYPVLLIISCVFLMITLVVYICIPELRGKLHGRCLMSMVSSLLAAFILTTIIQLGSIQSDTACLICAFLKQTTLLAAFFWLNIMCFDIWRSLKSMRPASESSTRSRQRFILYCIYAWGLPIIISTVTMVIQNLDKSRLGLIRPNFLNLKETCWFNDNRAMWLYLYMFILILVVMNTLFYFMVAYILLRAQNNQRLQRARSQNRDRMWLYGKLFLVMGITWITEVISWQQGTCEAWIFTDVINALEGFIIFLVFVCKKSTRQMVGRNVARIKDSVASSTDKSKRSSTFFMSTSRSGTSQNTNSSVVSNSSESHSLTGTAENHRNPEGPMAVISEEIPSQETSLVQQHNGNMNKHDSDEDCPSIPEDAEKPTENVDAEKISCHTSLNLENDTAPTINASENIESLTNVSRSSPISDLNSLSSNPNNVMPVDNSVDSTLVNGKRQSDNEISATQRGMPLEESSPLLMTTQDEKK